MKMAAIDQFRKAIISAGILPPVDIFADGKIHRFNSQENNRSDTAGWYIFHWNCVPAGAFGDWRSGVSRTWCAKKRTNMTPVEREDYSKRMGEIKRQRDEEQKVVHTETAEEATSIWEKAEPANNVHPYIRKKRIQLYGTRITNDGRLVLPLYDMADKLWSLQYIDQKGIKRFLAGGKKKGNFCPIPVNLELPSKLEELVICEGFSTGASIHEATGLPVFVAFDSGNLKEVAKNLHQKYPDAEITITGDDDAWKELLDPPEENTGKIAAKSAAKAVSGDCVLPDFKGLNTSSRPTDFNDLHRLADLNVVRDQIVKNFRRKQKEPALRENDSSQQNTKIALVDEDGKKKSQVTILIELSENINLFHDTDGTAYGVLKSNGHDEIWPIASRTIKEWLAGKFFELTEKGCSRNSLGDALNTIAAIAKFKGATRDVFLRVAHKNGTAYIDLGDPSWRVAEITIDGWRILDKSPIAFIRKKSTKALPTPKQGGDIAMLWQFLNITEHQRALIAAWIIAALRQKGPYPILILQGEQGSAKSTASRILRDFVDPSSVPLKSPPREERDFAAMAVNNWVIALDNLSGLQPWQADVICRIATGGGFGGRELYTNMDEVSIDVQRPVILNGIDDLSLRPDLASRAITINLQPIPDENRKEEQELWSGLNKVKPSIFGVLLDAVSCAMRNAPHVTLQRKPRMADFARWATAAESAFGFNSGDFMVAYDENIKSGVELSLAASEVGQGIISLISEKSNWSGTSTNLLRDLADYVDDRTKRSKYWPQIPQTLSNRLRRIAPSLRQIGIDVQFVKSGDRLIHITQHSVTSKTKQNAHSREKTVQAAQGAQNTNNQGLTMTDLGALDDIRTIPKSTIVQPKPSNTKALDDVDALGDDFGALHDSNDSDVGNTEIII